MKNWHLWCSSWMPPGVLWPLNPQSHVAPGIQGSQELARTVSSSFKIPSLLADGVPKVCPFYSSSVGHQEGGGVPLAV